MDRTHVCNFQKSGTLYRRQRSGEVNIALNPVDLAHLSFAFGAVGSVYLRMPKPDGHMLKRPAFTSRIQSDGHGRAGA